MSHTEPRSQFSFVTSAAYNLQHQGYLDGAGEPINQLTKESRKLFLSWLKPPKKELSWRHQRGDGFSCSKKFQGDRLVILKASELMHIDCKPTPGCASTFTCPGYRGDTTWFPFPGLPYPCPSICGWKLDWPRPWGITELFAELGDEGRPFVGHNVQHKTM